MPPATALKRVDPAPPRATNARVEREKTFTFFDERAGRMVTDKVNHARYVALWNAGLFRFQQEEKDKPEWMPEPSEKW
jgi:hypothetical protein